jgi:REP element-mobilizing transposase RayT
LKKEIRDQLSDYFYKYAQEKGIYMKANYVNPDHVHMVIDMPTNYAVQEIFRLFKGSSSNWVNKNKLLKVKLNWCRGYAAFSVSQSNLDKVCAYIRNQEEHHRIKTFSEEYQEFIEKYELKYFKNDEDEDDILYKEK